MLCYVHCTEDGNGTLRGIGVTTAPRNTGDVHLWNEGGVRVAIRVEGRPGLRSTGAGVPQAHDWARMCHLAA